MTIPDPTLTLTPTPSPNPDLNPNPDHDYNLNPKTTSNPSRKTFTASFVSCHKVPTFHCVGSQRRVRVSQETGGRFDAVHVRSTDWAADHRDWYVEPERLAPKALQVTCCNGLLCNTGTGQGQGQGQGQGHD